MDSISYSTRCWRSPDHFVLGRSSRFLYRHIRVFVKSIVCISISQKGIKGPITRRDCSSNDNHRSGQINSLVRSRPWQGAIGTQSVTIQGCIGNSQCTLLHNMRTVGRCSDRQEVIRGRMGRPVCRSKKSGFMKNRIIRPLSRLATANKVTGK